MKSAPIPLLRSVRLRLTCWYVLLSGGLLMAFSMYVLSSVSRDLHREFDRDLLNAAANTGSYFEEFAEKQNISRGAEEAIRELKRDNQHLAIFRGDDLLAASDGRVVTLAKSLIKLKGPGAAQGSQLSTDAPSNTRVAAMPLNVGSAQFTVAVAESMQDLTREVSDMRRIILLGLPAALLLIAVGGLMLAGKSLKPVIAISEQAASISARNLNERLTITSQDEFGRLAGVMNALLSRLDDSFRVMREFMADASHELRTPLAIVHGEADVSLSRERTSEDYRESLTVIRDNSKRMSVIVSDILDLARADSGQQMLRKEELYLDDLVSSCCRGAQRLAQRKQISLFCRTEQDIAFHGDEELLKRMAMNLLYNAIQYTPAGGSVSVELACEDGWSRLRVVDNGIGIEPESVPRVFDRFYRVAKSRSRAEGGSGLGLAIVELAAESHGGTVSVHSEPGRGSTFTVAMPLSA